MKNDGRINLRVPAAEKAMWEEQAELCGYSLSDWIRVRCDVGRGEVCVDGLTGDIVPMAEAKLADLPPEKFIRKHHPTCRCNMCLIDSGVIKDPGAEYR